jgi:folate-dependent tRNA-U54 methylase TrmFO/GidA
LAVDRDAFSDAITQSLMDHPVNGPVAIIVKE